jgi:Zn-dependent protease
MKIFGIPVKVQPYFFLVVGLFGYLNDRPFEYIVEWIIVVFISILAHEFGHALSVRAFGLSPQILIYGFGGVTSWTDDKGVSPPKHIAISLAGPFAGFLFYGIVYLSNWALPDLFADHRGRQIYLDLQFVNLGWGFFNLLPVLPLDGGNVAYSIEQWVTKKRGGLITRVVSLLVAGVVVLWALSVGRMWIVFLMAIFAWNNGGALFQLLQYDRDGRVRPLLDQAQEAVKNDDGATAVQLSKEALNSARSVEMKEEAQRLLLQGLILGADLERAKKEADRLQAVYGHAALLQALGGFERRRLPRAIPVIEYSYATAPSPDLNFTFANALIAAGRLREALPLIARQQQPEYAAGAYKMLQIAAFHSGEFELSTEAGRQAFERMKDPEVAYNIACAEARAGREDQALPWIERAVEAGYSNGAALASDSDLETLRSRPEFEAICERLRGAVV